MKRCAQCQGKLGLGLHSVRCGTAAGGFRCAIVRRIVRPITSSSDTTPAPTVAGTPSYLAPVRRAEPNATSPEMPLWHLVLVHMHSSSREDHG